MPQNTWNGCDKIYTYNGTNEITVKKKNLRAKWRKEYVDAPETKTKKSSCLWAQDSALSLLEAMVQGKSWWLPKVHYLIKKNSTLISNVKIKRNLLHRCLYKEDPFATALSSDVVSVMIANHMPSLINVNICKNIPKIYRTPK